MTKPYMRSTMYMALTRIAARSTQMLPAMLIAKQTMQGLERRGLACVRNGFARITPRVLRMIRDE